MLSPFVYWGQTDSTLSLRVDLKNIQNPQIELNDRVLKFSGRGHGAKGVCQYAFEIDFYGPVDSQESFYKLIDRDIEFVLKKVEAKLWPRLLSGLHKPAWLKVDFDKMDGDDSDEEGVDDWRKTTQNSLRDLGIKNFGRQKKSSLTPEEFRKVYLFLYNMFQLVGFSYMLLILSIRYAVEGPNSMEGSYYAIGFVMKFLHLMKLLEVLHPLLGYTTGSSLFAGLQLAYRAFIIFLMIDGEPRMQTKPVVFYLFMIWTIGDIVRYPYCMLRAFKVNVGYLAWLHYSLWMILYPLAFICEGVIFLRNIPYFDETQRYSLALPNASNFSFSMPIFIRLHLLIGLFPFFCMSMTRMYKKRVLMFGSKRSRQQEYGKAS